VIYLKIVPIYAGSFPVCYCWRTYFDRTAHVTGSEEIVSNGGDESGATTAAASKRKLTYSYTNKVSYKNEWKPLYPISEVKHNKYKFHCLPCGRTHHQGLKDVKGNCNKHS